MRLLIDESLEHRNKVFEGKMTREELGELVLPDYNVQSRRTTLSNWNVGKLTPKPEVCQLVKIAKVCGVSVDYLLGVEAQPC